MPYIGKQPANVPVTADDIPNDSITSAKILDNVITISDIGPNAVGNSEMADDAVGLNELSAGGTTNTSTFLRGDNSWAVPPNTVYTHPNHSGDVTSSADGATTIANNAVTTGKINDGDVTTAKLAADCITAVKIADDVINATHIEDGQILTAALGDDAVTAAKLANSINTDIAKGPAALPKAGGTMTGNVIHNDNKKVLFGSDSDGEMYHSGSQLIIKDTSSEMKILATRVQFQNAGASENIASFNADGAVELYYNNVKKMETTAAGINFPDNSKLLLGNSDDSEIYFDGTDLYLKSPSEVLIRSNTNENMIKCVKDAQVNLYYNNATKLATSTTGVTVTGRMESGGVYNNSDLVLESNSNVYLKRNTGGGATMLKAVVDGAVELYHDNTKKFETTATGVAVTGKITGAVGSVLQVVENTAHSVVASNPSSYTTLYSATITPSSSSNKILVTAVVGGLYLNYGGNQNQTNWRIARGSSNATGANTHYQTEVGRSATGTGERAFITMQVLDEPGTTSATTYNVQVIRQAGGGGISIGDTSGTSAITLMEIGA